MMIYNTHTCILNDCIVLFVMCGNLSIIRKKRRNEEEKNKSYETKVIRRRNIFIDPSLSHLIPHNIYKDLKNENKRKNHIIRTHISAVDYIYCCCCCFCWIWKKRKQEKKANNEVKTRNVHKKERKKKYMKDSIQHPRMDKKKRRKKKFITTLVWLLTNITVVVNASESHYDCVSSFSYYSLFFNAFSVCSRRSFTHSINNIMHLTWLWLHSHLTILFF